MECPQCGAEIYEDFNFCCYCGFPLKETNREALKAKSWQARLKGKMKDAIRYCEMIEDKDAYSYKNLGDIYYFVGNLNKSIDSLEKCIEKNSDFIMAHYWLGIAYYHRGNFEKAIENYEALLSKNPDSKIAHYHLGIVYMAMSNYEAAIENFEKLLEVDKNDAALFYHLGRAYHLNYNTLKAIKVLREAVRINSENERAKKLLNMLTEISEP